MESHTLVPENKFKGSLKTGSFLKALELFLELQDILLRQQSNVLEICSMMQTELRVGSQDLQR